MHEYAVTKNITDIAVEEAKKAGAGRILEIRLVIGDLSSFADESIRMCFDIISKATVAEGAKLVFKRVPAKFKCNSCSSFYDGKRQRGFECPKCGGAGTLTDRGKEFYIESIEAE